MGGPFWVSETPLDVREEILLSGSEALFVESAMLIRAGRDIEPRRVKAAESRVGDQV